MPDWKLHNDKYLEFTITCLKTLIIIFREFHVVKEIRITMCQASFNTVKSGVPDDYFLENNRKKTRLFECGILGFWIVIMTFVVEIFNYSILCCCRKRITHQRVIKDDYLCSTEEIFPRDLSIILKNSVHNYWKILKKCWQRNYVTTVCTVPETNLLSHDVFN